MRKRLIAGLLLVGMLSFFGAREASAHFTYGGPSVIYSYVDANGVTWCGISENRFQDTSATYATLFVDVYGRTGGFCTNAATVYYLYGDVFLMKGALICRDGGFNYANFTQHVYKVTSGLASCGAGSTYKTRSSTIVHLNGDYRGLTIYTSPDHSMS